MCESSLRSSECISRSSLARAEHRSAQAGAHPQRAGEIRGRAAHERAGGGAQARGAGGRAAARARGQRQAARASHLRDGAEAQEGGALSGRAT